MSDVNANISVNIDTSTALAQLKSLQRQLALFHSSVAKSSAAAQLAQGQLQRELLNTINATGKFAGTMVTIKTSTESFTHALETNKFGMRDYFRYAGASTKTFGRLFKNEFDTIGKVTEDRVKTMQTQYIKMGRDASGAVKAMAVRPLVLDMSNFATQTQMAAQRQALFNQLIKQGSTNLLNFGKNTQWAGRQLMVGFTIPLMAVATQSSKTFMEMETAALKFRKVYGDLFTTQEESQQALKDIQDLSKSFTQYGISAASTVSLASEAAAAGFKGLDLQRQTTQATRLSILGQIEQQQALETTIALQNAFSISSADLADNINFLNAVENQTVLSLDDVTIAIPKVAPVIQQLGGDVKDLAFFLTAMKEGGVNASEGANALKSGLASLINPANSARKMLSGLGIDIVGIVEKDKGNLKKTVVSFAQALDTLAPLQRAQAIEQMFGKFQFARLSALFSNVTKEGTQASRVLDLANASIEELADSANKELGIASESAMFKFKKSVEDLKIALQPIGEVFLKTVTPVIDLFSGLLQRFSGLSDGAKKFITVMVIGVGALAPVLLMLVGLFANLVANGMKGALLLRNAFLRLTGQSKILAEQTNYLNAEQLEAATVAASLNQSHTNLTQTFTIEAAAVEALRNAYLNANLAAKEFATRNPGMMLPKKVKGYASGIVSVPGPKGAGDVVPAMLSPGEAVIPTKMVQKYAPLIQGMVADNIPGYKVGRPGRGASGRVGKSNTTVMRNMQANISSSGGLVGFGGLDTGNISDITSIYVDEILKEAKLTLASVSQEIKNWERVNKEAIVSATKAVNAGVPAQKAYAELTDKFKVDMETASGPVSQFTKTAKTMMPELSKDLTQAQQHAKSFGLNIKNADDAVKLSQGLPGNIFANKVTKPGNFQTRSRARGAAASIFGGTAGIPLYGVPGFMTGSVEPNTPAYNIRSSQEHFAQTKEQQQNLLQNKQIRQGAKQNVGAYNSGLREGGLKDIYEQSRNRRSPHPLASQDGAADAKAYSQAEARSLKASQSYANLYGEGNPITATDKSIRRNQSKTMADLSRERVVSKTFIANATLQEKAMRVNAERLAKMNSVMMNGSFALTGLAAAGSMAGGALGSVSSQIMKFSGLLYALMAVTQLVTQTKIAELVTNRLAMAKQVGAFASYGKGMAGGAGIFSTLARFAIVMKTFLGPIGLATTALMGAYAIIKRNNSVREEERKRLQAFGDTLKNSEAAVSKLGGYFNFQPSKSLYKTTSSISYQSPDQANAVDQFMGSEDFKDASVQSVVASVGKLKTNKDVVSALTIAGYQMLSSGASKENVQVYIDSILAAAKKTDITIDFKSLAIDKDNIDSIMQQYSNAFSNLGSSYKTGLKIKPIRVENANNPGTYRTENITSRTKELNAEIKNQAQTISTFNDSISNAFQNGLISSEKFLSSFKTLNAEIIKNTPNSEEAIKLLAMSIELTDPALAKFVKQFNNYNDAALVMQARTLGIAVSQETLSLMSAKTSGDLIISAAQVAAANGLLEIVMERLAKITETVKAAGTVTGGKTGEAALAKRIQDLKDQNKVMQDLRKSSIDYATAQELSSDSEIRAMLLKARAAGLSSKAWKEAIAQIKTYAKVSKNLQQSLIAGQEQGDYEKSRLDMAQNYIALQEHLIDMQNKPQLEKYQTEIDNISTKLDVLKTKEDEINASYDKQIAALSKVKSLNENVLNLQKQRLDVANALTTGDISAAASAIQQARSQQASTSMSVAEGALGAGKENAIAALGRTVLEKQLSLLQQQQKALQDNIQAEKDRIKWLGMTKDQIDDAVKALDLAKNANIDINDPNFLNNILKGAKGDADSLAKALAQVAIEAKKALADIAALRTKSYGMGTITGGGSPYIGSSGGYDASGRYVGTPFGQAPTTIGSSGGYDAAGTYVGSGFGQAMYGGFIKKMAPGGLVSGSGMTDKVPTLLTPGEYVVNKNAANKFGPLLQQINDSKYPSSLSFATTPMMATVANSATNNNTAVYNYSLNVSANTDGANPDDIARTVITHIRNMDAQRIRSNR
jgi:TP901 family phage tail tape measure protein